MIDLHYAIPYVIVCTGCIALFIASFSRKYHGSARWPIRIVFILLTPVSLVWAATGFYLASDRLLPPDVLWHFRFVHTTLGGVALGLLVTLVVNPEFYRSIRKAHASV